MHALQCYECGSRYEDVELQRCQCGEPLWFNVDMQRAEWPGQMAGGVGRYADFLPIDGVDGIGVAAGGTPLFRADRLDDLVGGSVFVKDETENPTGSFKDRGSTVGTAFATERDIDWVGTQSKGNMAMSMAANAASAGLECLVLIPDTTPEARLKAIAQYDPTIVQVDDYRAFDDIVTELEPELDALFVSADDTLRVAGQKTVAFEICEWFNPDPPDAIVLPVSSGGNASAVWKGLRDLSDAGLIDDVPRLYLVQTAASDPIARAYRGGEPNVSPVDRSESIALSITNRNPTSGNRALEGARQTGGAVTAVSETAIEDATKQMAAHAGLSSEPASAVTLAGARRLVENGEIDANESVVLIATGTGFKELAGFSMPDDTVSVEVATARQSLLELVN